jgi:hypothetical protein
MKRRSRRHSLRALFAATIVTIGTLAALVPTLEAADVVIPHVVTQATPTNTDPDKKVFAKCPTGETATGGGAQVFIHGLQGVPPGQLGKIGITQVIPSQDLNGYAARAQAQAGLRFPWHLTAYAICR